MARLDNGLVSGRQQAHLGAVQETLFIPLLARAREARKKRPALRDPKAVEIVEAIEHDAAKYGRGWGGFVMVLRTAIFDTWVQAFLAEHPAGTVVEIGSGLNTRFERVDNGRVRWIDLDLADTIELRRRFFRDTERRRMVAASFLDDSWLPAVEESPGPYFFVADGVLVYLREDELSRALARIVDRFPGALMAFDTYPQRTFERQARMTARRGMDARWAWACDNPRSLERLGLRPLESTSISRPPRALRDQLPARYRYILPLFDRLIRGTLAITLFRAGPQP